MAKAAIVLRRAELEKKLKRLPDAVKAQIRKAMEAGADEIVALAKSLVPVDSGALKDSIGWTWGRAPKGAMTLAKVASNQLGAELTLTIYAGNSDAGWYARFVEFGTRNAAAQPFFFVSYRALRRRVRSRITRSITKSAKRVAAGG